VEKKFSNDYAIPRQILFKIADVFETMFPNLLTYEFWRQLLPRHEFRMHADDEHLFVVTAIKDSNVSAVRQTFHAPPEVIMIQVLCRWRFERIDLTSLRIHAGHHMLDGAIFACCVHCLKNQEHSPLVLCV